MPYHQSIPPIGSSVNSYTERATILVDERKETIDFEVSRRFDDSQDECSTQPGREAPSP